MSAYPPAAISALACLLATLSLASPVLAEPTVAAPAVAAAEPDEAFAVHAQFTSLTQYHPGFRSAYRGTNSFDPGNRGSTTNDATLYLGMRPWHGAEIWLNGEIDHGFGLSNTLGAAGFPSAEAYKVGRNAPYFRLQRWFLRQTFDLGGETARTAPDLNQLGAAHSADRLVLTVGRFSVGDVFDSNRYAHDPRADFMNWAAVDTSTFDYAADAWGYTTGGAAELYRGAWTLRGGVFDLSDVPNSKRLDNHFGQFQLISEMEHRHQLGGRPGAFRITGFLTRGRMGLFDDAVRYGALHHTAVEMAPVRTYASRSGLSATLEQAVSADMGVFVRAGWAQGDRESYEFTDVDRTLAAGLSRSGAAWGAADDTVGAVLILNQASGQRQAYLAAGGLGILVGDGRLPHPGDEQILEAYYKRALAPWAQLTLDYQAINNPGYNRDRGPVSVLGARLHLQR